MKFLVALAVASLALAAPIDIEERGKPGSAVTSTSSAPPAGATTACYNNACGGGYPWKRDEELVEREVEVVEREVEVLEERGKPGSAVTSTSSAPPAGATTACYNNACGGGYPWKRDEEELVERELVEPVERAPVVEELEERGKPGSAVTSTSSAPPAGATTACYNNACGGGYPW